MEKLISCCGLDCAACDARIATVTNDDELLMKTAEKWRVLYNAPTISTENIKCTGCREAGAKMAHCAQCEVRNCAESKNFQTCAECDSLENCKLVGEIHKFAPNALENLKNLN